MNDFRSASPEKRLATFFKCDIVDLTRLANQLDLDDQRLLSRAFREAVERVAAAHVGHIMRFEGDAVLMSFGHPDPREDAAECAIRVQAGACSRQRAGADRLAAAR